MPERLHGETGDCNESNSPSSLVSHSANPRMGKIGNQEVFGNTAHNTCHNIVNISGKFERPAKTKIQTADSRRKNRFSGSRPHHKLGLGSLRISRSTKSPSDPIGDNLLPIGGPVA